MANVISDSQMLPHSSNALDTAVLFSPDGTDGGSGGPQITPSLVHRASVEMSEAPSMPHMTDDGADGGSGLPNR